MAFRVYPNLDHIVCIHVPCNGLFNYNLTFGLSNLLFARKVGNLLKPSGHYMYRTVVTICTAQWSRYVPPV